MQLDIIGPRVLVRAYSLPEKSAGGIVFADKWRDGYDGKLFEVVQTSDAFRLTLTAVGMTGDKVIVGLAGKGDPPLEVEVDDIIECRGYLRGVYAGGQVERHFGYPCWFLNATEVIGGHEKPTIAWVWPSRTWKEQAA